MNQTASPPPKILYLTGSTGGMGRAIHAELASRPQYRVVPVLSRLENQEALVREVESLLEESPPWGIINAAGFGMFRPHEQISPRDIQNMVAVNLTAPMVLAKLCLPAIQKNSGRIIHIASIEATRSSKWAALYSATKAGLRSFSLSLQEDLRRFGAGVTCINPDLTRTGFFDNLEFRPSPDPAAAIEPAELARIVADILEQPNIVTEITIRPPILGIQKGPRT
ncbi:SDR family NAD(P)-dependent oxidoreductase [Spirochaeta lutea]|uniref:Short-chain dehydrogenase n=1 Tax=Spirochaeta lutea TaxID=1480694 RepID=A0A098QXA9_9SPIO|nr:SDR family oxidoreductase [Spirochaeta lutea]KGE72068.1 hypothetical protein DC28_08170 [Spirochaeta lutea]